MFIQACEFFHSLHIISPRWPEDPGTNLQNMMDNFVAIDRIRSLF